MLRLCWSQQVVPNMEDCLRLVNKQSGVGGDKCVPNNMGMGRPAKPAYSPTSMLYPLTSIESFSDAGQSMGSIDANAISANCLMTRDSGMTAGGYTESDVAEEELGLRRSPRSSGSRSKGSKQPKEKRKVGRCVACARVTTHHACLHPCHLACISVPAQRASSVKEHQGQGRVGWPTDVSRVRGEEEWTAHTTCKVLHVHRRPIAYTGDPEAADLTPAERRRIKRRIANRESARRVRARRQDQIEDMAQKVPFQAPLCCTPLQQCSRCSPTCRLLHCRPQWHPFL